MRNIILSFFLIIALWLGGLVYFRYYTNSYRIDTSTITDLVVVITGGRQRIETGVKLLKAGYAPILFIASATPNQLKNYLVENNVRPEQLVYGANVVSTKDKAREIIEFVNNNSIRSIRLVTSAYHMPRALNEVRKIAHPGLVIIPHPVMADYQSYSILFTEYNKYLVATVLEFFR